LELAIRKICINDRRTKEANSFQKIKRNIRMNIVLLSGNIGLDPEIKVFESGSKKNAV